MLLKRVIYFDDPALALGAHVAEYAYGARLVVLPADAPPPGVVRAERGTLIHLDPLTDPRWVQGDVNPMLDWLALKCRIPAHVSGVVDLDDRWDEYRFLTAVAPELAPPRTELVSRFTAEPASRDELAAATAAVRSVAARSGLAIGELVRLEVLRRRVHAELGAALLKGRGLFTSEGKLPATGEDWAGLYAGWVRRAREKAQELAREVQGTSESLESRLKDLPHVKGRLLEMVLADPSCAIAQRLAPVEKEVRIHVVEGEVLAGATFLRFYPAGHYLTPAEAAAVARAVRIALLDRLPPEVARFSCAADAILEAGTGRVRIIDLNGGLESGYYYPEEDLFTTNLLAARYRGGPTPLLADFARVMDAAPGDERAGLLRSFRGRLAGLMTGDVGEAFWDRVLAYHMRAIVEQPDADALDAALAELAAAGLEQASVCGQLIAWAEDTYPGILRGLPRRASWAELVPASASF